MFCKVAIIAALFSTVACQQGQEVADASLPAEEAYQTRLVTRETVPSRCFVISGTHNSATGKRQNSIACAP